MLWRRRPGGAPPCNAGGFMGFPSGNFTITNEETGRVLGTIRGSGEGVILVGSAAVPQDVWFVKNGKLISLYIENQRNIGEQNIVFWI
jgi:hypothetical protein